METHFNTDIEDADVQVPKYTLLRADRKERSRSEVAVYMRDDITPQVLLSYSDPAYDTIIVYIRQNNIILSNTYSQPDALNHIVWRLPHKN